MDHGIQCAAKKYPLKFLCLFLSNRSEFLRNFTRLLLIHNYVKLSSNNVLFLIMTKLLYFLGDHVVISDVHGMFAERRMHHILQCDAKIRRDLNNKINNIRRYSKCLLSAFMHAFNC